MAVVIGLGMWLNPGSYCGPCGDFWDFQDFFFYSYVLHCLVKKKIKVENEENP